MTSLHSNQRPYKVWSCNRESRKSVVAGSLFEFKLRAAEKLGYDNISELKVVLESDGTEIEDDNYFQTAEKDTVFLLLNSNESWLPRGVGALKAAIKAIPKIVCDAISSLELTDKTPAWQIMGDKGNNVTVVLNWDQKERHAKGDSTEPSSWRVEVMTSQPESKAQYYSSSMKQSSIPQTLHSASTSRAKLTLDGLSPRPTARTLPTSRSLSIDEDDVDVYGESEKTEEGFSPTHDHSLCDFHCAAMHRGGGTIYVNRTNATSPIQDRISPIPILTASAESISSATGAIPKKPSLKGHVRFKDIEHPTQIPVSAASTSTANGVSEESESETTETQEEPICERYLLLVDQVTSYEKDTHLTVKDIGTILERLSSKIVDIEKLEREKDGRDCYNWVIKATIRGDVLREIGVIYNGKYYGIMEHPGYF